MADVTLLPNSLILERNIHLSELVHIIPRSLLPHNEWTLLHDAILIRAVTKHGWLDSHANCSAIENDKTIRWGPPFQASMNISIKNNTEMEIQANYDYLYKIASRAVTYLNKVNESFSDKLAAPVFSDVS